MSSYTYTYHSLNSNHPKESKCPFFGEKKISGCNFGMSEVAIFYKHFIDTQFHSLKLAHTQNSQYIPVLQGNVFQRLLNMCICIYVTSAYLLNLHAKFSIVMLQNQNFIPECITSLALLVSVYYFHMCVHAYVYMSVCTRVHLWSVHTCVETRG